MKKDMKFILIRIKLIELIEIILTRQSFLEQGNNQKSKEEILKSSK